MNPFDVSGALKSMVIIADTREKPTDRAKYRYRRMGVPVIQQKLDCGDYSAKCSLLDLSDKVCVERKMNLEELSMCFFQQRGRFEREFQRAKERGIKIYLLVENASIDHVYAHKYRTQVHPNAMIASILAWMARYNCQLLFCDELNTGVVIHDILYRELKERLENLEDIAT